MLGVNPPLCYQMCCYKIMTNTGSPRGRDGISAWKGGGGHTGAGAWAMVTAHRDGTGVCLLAENEHCVNKRKGNGCYAEKNHSWLLRGKGVWRSWKLWFSTEYMRKWTVIFLVFTGTRRRGESPGNW